MRIAITVNGKERVVEFDRQPTDAEIDEVAAQLSASEKKTPYKDPYGVTSNTPEQAAALRRIRERTATQANGTGLAKVTAPKDRQPTAQPKASYSVSPSDLLARSLGKRTETTQEKKVRATTENVQRQQAKRQPVKPQRPNPLVSQKKTDVEDIRPSIRKTGDLAKGAAHLARKRDLERKMREAEETKNLIGGDPALGFDRSQDWEQAISDFITGDTAELRELRKKDPKTLTESERNRLAMGPGWLAGLTGNIVSGAIAGPSKTYYGLGALQGPDSDEAARHILTSSAFGVGGGLLGPVAKGALKGATSKAAKIGAKGGEATPAEQAFANMFSNVRQGVQDLGASLTGRTVAPREVIRDVVNVSEKGKAKDAAQAAVSGPSQPEGEVGKATLTNAARRPKAEVVQRPPVDPEDVYRDIYGVDAPEARAVTPEPTVPEQAQAPKPTLTGDPNQTRFAASNQASNDLRASVGVGPVAPTPGVPTVKDFDLARRTYTLDEALAEARSILQLVASGGRAPVLDRAGVLQIAQAEADLKGQYNAITDQIRQTVEQGGDASALTIQRDSVRQAIEDVTQASKYVGTEQSRAFSARNLATYEDYTPAGLYNEFTATAGRKLSDSERKVADDLGLKITELEQKVREFEAREAARKSQQSLNAHKARAASKGSVEAIQARRAAAIERLKANSKELVLGGQAGAGIDPSKLGAIAGDVLEIAKTYAEEGLVKLADNVARVKADLQSAGLDVDESDIHRILAGEYDRPTKPTMSEAQKRLAELRKAAKDTDAARNARAERLGPKREAAASKAAEARKSRARVAAEAKAERERIAAARAEGRAQAQKERSQARKEYTKWWRESIPGQRERIHEQIGRLEEMIRTGDVAQPKARTKPPKELEDLIIKREALKVEADNYKAKLKAEREWEQKSTGEKALLEASSTLRGVKATLDLSAVLNQGMWLIRTGRWGTVGRGAKDMVQSFLSPAKYTELRASLKSNPALYEKARAAGLAINASDLDEPSEYAVTKLLGTPVTVKGVDVNPLAGADRAYNAFLNRVRLDTFDSLVRGQERPWMGQFLPKRLSPKELSLDELKATAEYVNNVTGTASTTGRVGGFANAMKSANENLPVFFAPGYRISRWQVALGHPLFRAQTRRNPRLAAQVLQDYLAFGASILGTVQAAKAMGYEVDTDLQSPMFGQLKMGDTYVDITGGLLKPLQVMAAATTGAKQLGSRTAGKPQPFQVAGSYAASGLHPALATPATAIAGAQGAKLFGKTYDPKTPEGQKNLWMLFAPISIGQQAEIEEDKSLTPAQKTVLRIAAILGAGVNYREPR